MRKIFIILLLFFVGCTTSKGVEIRPYAYPTINKAHLTNAFDNGIIAYEHYEARHLIRAWLSKMKAEDDLDKLIRSIGFKIGIKIRW